MIKKISPEDWFGIILISITFILFVFLTIEKIDNRKQVANRYDKTIGTIVKYDIFGDGPNRHVIYEYTVNDKIYTRLINGPKKLYDECDEDISLCSQKKFLVLYSRKYPSKSLIDLTKEIDDINEVQIPNSLRNFQ